jgi:hypothetical protein
VLLAGLMAFDTIGWLVFGWDVMAVSVKRSGCWSCRPC